MALSEAEKIAIRQAFAEDMEDTEVAVVGLVGTHRKNLSKAGGDAVYRVLVGRGWVVNRGTTTDVSNDDILNELTGWIVVVKDNVPFTRLPWNYAEELAREGAEAVLSRMNALKWGVTRNG